MTKIKNVTLADVARAAGLSNGGASYALRGDPRLRPATVERARRAAERLGYRPDLRISSLMASIRRARSLDRRETLALVWAGTPRPPSRLPPHLRAFAENARRGIVARAEHLGCSVDEFWLGADGMTPGRLQRILVARGISGIVVVPVVRSTKNIALDWDWKFFAGAIVSNTDCTPPLDRSALNHFRSVWMTLERLRAEGRARPAIILDRDVQERIHSIQLSSFLGNHPDPKAAAGYVGYGQPGKVSHLRAWLRKTAPDALMVAWQLDKPAAETLRKMAPRSCRMVTLEWYPHGVLPGVDPCDTEVAANAVELVVAQLHRNERGAPARPVTTMLDGIWTENGGGSPQASRA